MQVVHLFFRISRGPKSLQCFDLDVRPMRKPSHRHITCAKPHAGSFLGLCAVRKKAPVVENEFKLSARSRHRRTSAGQKISAIRLLCRIHMTAIITREATTPREKMNHRRR